MYFRVVLNLFKVILQDFIGLTDFYFPSAVFLAFWLVWSLTFWYALTSHSAKAPESFWQLLGFIISKIDV